MKKVYIKSVVEYLDNILKFDVEEDEVLLYRGLTDSSYELLPGIYTCDEKDIENKQYRRCMIDYPEVFTKDHVNNLAKIQHYKKKTRLLDFSFDPLVSLYFAVVGEEGKEPGVSVIKIKKSDILHHTSDKAMMLACLATFSDDDKDYIRKFCIKNKDKVINEDLIKGKHTMKRFLHEIRRECPAFDCEIIPSDLLNSYFIRTYKSTNRIIKQEGLFMIFGLYDKKCDDNPAEKNEIVRFVIRKNVKDEIKKDLKKLRVSENRYFSEFSYEQKEVDYGL